MFSHTFDDKFLKSDLLDVSTLINDCKEFVACMKRSGLLQQLQRTLKQKVNTRWNTHFDMMESISSQFEAVEELLDSKEEGHRIAGICSEKLIRLVDFLKPFKDATVELESDSYPTIQKVILWRDQLVSHCSSDVEEGEYMKKLKARAKGLIFEKMDITVEHKISTFFDPRFRQMKMLTVADGKLVLNRIGS